MIDILDKNPGIITVINWTMAPDGDKYCYFWAPKWVIMTDKMMPVEGFRSTEHWQLVGMKGDKAVCVIPGCQVKAWLRCEKRPKRAGCYAF